MAGSKRTSRAGKPRKSAETGDLKDWREVTLARVRALILEADPEMIEERKWKKPSNAMVGVPVWSHNGIVCTGETYKDKREAHVRQGSLARGSSRPLQFQPGRRHAKSDRHPRR